MGSSVARRARKVFEKRTGIQTPRRPNPVHHDELLARAHRIAMLNLRRPIVPDDVAFMVPKAMLERRGMNYGPDAYMIILLHQRRGVVGADFSGGLQWEIGVSAKLPFDAEFAVDAARLVLMPDEVIDATLVTEPRPSCFWAQVTTLYLPEGREQMQYEALTKPIPEDHLEEYKPADYVSKTAMSLPTPISKEKVSKGGIILAKK